MTGVGGRTLLDGSAWGGVEHASALRITILLIWLIIAAITPLERFAMFDSSLFEGFGLERPIVALFDFYPGLLTEPALIVVRCLLIATSVSALVWHRWAYGMTAVAFVLALALDAVVKGLGGFANHAQSISLVLFALVVVLPPERHLTVLDLLRSRTQPVDRFDADLPRCRLFVTLSSVVVVLPYSFIGLQRIVDGGVGMFTGDVLTQYLAAATHSLQSLPAWLTSPAVAVALNLGFAATTLLEASSVFVLMSLRFRRLWLIGMGVFHIATLPLMNILFWENALLALTLLWWGWVQPDNGAGRAAATHEADANLRPSATTQSLP